MGTRVIGIGGAAAGDDGVGLVVVDALRAADVPRGVELLAVAEPTRLVPLLDGCGQVVLIDAVIDAGTAGEVLVLELSALDTRRVQLLSSHGISVADALALARTLYGAAAASDVCIVGICIDRMARPALALSPAVAAAVPRAVEVVLGRLELGWHVDGYG